MSESNLSLAGRLAANLFVDAIKLAKPGARLAAKVGDRLLGGSPFNEREAQRFLTMGGAEGAFHADGGPAEWVEPVPTIASAFSALDTTLADAAEMFPQHTTRHFGISKGLPGIVENITMAHEFNTMPNWPQSSAPVAPKPADVAGSPESTPAPPLPGVGSGHQQPVHAGVTGPGMDVVAPDRPTSELLNISAAWISARVDDPRLVAELRDRAAQFKAIED